MTKPESSLNCKLRKFIEKISSADWHTWTIIICVFVFGVIVSIVGGVFADNLTQFLEGFFLNVGTELIGAAVTFVFFNWVIQQREKRETLMERIKGENNKVAIDALTELKGKGLLSKDKSVLKGQVVRGAQWNNAALEDCGLQGIILTNSMLEEASLTSADLSNAILIEAKLKRIYLNNANLTKANFRGAELQGANLSGADLNECDFTRANLTNAILDNVQNLDKADFTAAIGIDLTQSDN